MQCFPHSRTPIPPCHEKSGAQRGQFSQCRWYTPLAFLYFYSVFIHCPCLWKDLRTGFCAIFRVIVRFSTKSTFVKWNCGKPVITVDNHGNISRSSSFFRGEPCLPCAKPCEKCGKPAKVFHSLPAALVLRPYSAYALPELLPKKDRLSSPALWLPAFPGTGTNYADFCMF